MCNRRPRGAARVAHNGTDCYLWELAVERFDVIAAAIRGCESHPLRHSLETQARRRSCRPWPSKPRRQREDEQPSDERDWLHPRHVSDDRHLCRYPHQNYRAGCKSGGTIKRRPREDQDCRCEEGAANNGEEDQAWDEVIGKRAASEPFPRNIL